jgi:hypothetical protein
MYTSDVAEIFALQSVAAARYGEFARNHFRKFRRGTAKFRAGAPGE